MAVIRPFKAIRPSQKYAEKVASKPYDVLDSDEAREEVQDNEYSFLRIIKPEINFPAESKFEQKPFFPKPKNYSIISLKQGFLNKKAQRVFTSTNW